MAKNQPPVVEDVLKNLLGPPDVGAPHEGEHSQQPVFDKEDICSRCGHSRSEHPIIRDPELGSVTHCPEI
jgi:hypothetical protein